MAEDIDVKLTIVETSKLERLLDCLEFYAVKGLGNVHFGQAFDSRLAQEFYSNGEFARKILAEWTSGIVEDDDECGYEEPK